MKKFKYQIRDDKNKTLKGAVEANDLASALRILRSRNYFIINLEEVKETEIDLFMLRFQKVKVDDLVNFTRQLSTMISAGLPLTQAMDILKNQTSPAMSRVIARVEQEIQSGTSLADAMETQEEVFPRVYTALVRAGESAGVLDEILKRLATNLEKQRDFRNKTRGAMVYPAIVIIGMMSVAAIMMIFVVPKLTEMYKDFGADLPLPTQILMSTSDFAVKYWYMVAVVLGALGYFVGKWSRTEIGGIAVENMMFKIPVLGPLRRQIIMTEFTRTMSLLVSAGISILNSLDIVSEAVGSRIFKQLLLEASSKVEKGQPLAASLAIYSEFPAIVPQMIAVGEQTGKVDEILDKLANYFDGESENAVKTLTTAIEPLIMVVMGIGVGFLVMAVIMPIYNLTSQF
jgi:type IV pilus assembly protein PilC